MHAKEIAALVAMFDGNNADEIARKILDLIHGDEILQSDPLELPDDER